MSIDPLFIVWTRTTDQTMYPAKGQTWDISTHNQLGDEYTHSKKSVPTRVFDVMTNSEIMLRISAHTYMCSSRTLLHTTHTQKRADNKITLCSTRRTHDHKHLLIICRSRDLHNFRRVPYGQFPCAGAVRVPCTDSFAYLMWPRHAHNARNDTRNKACKWCQ